MRRYIQSVGVCLAVLGLAVRLQAQNGNVAVMSDSAMPMVQTPAAYALQIIRFSAMLPGARGQAVAGPAGVTVALYAGQEGGAPLWLETQNVQLDEQGRYSVLPGAMSNEGLPLEIFSSGEARWLGIQFQGQPEQARMLLSVPYALKAVEAETLSGKTASDFVLSEQLNTQVEEAIQTQINEQGLVTTGGDSPAALVDGSGTAGRIPKFTSATVIGDSELFQDGSARIGLGTTTPGEKLHVLQPATTRVKIEAQSTTKFTSSGFVLRNAETDPAFSEWHFFAQKDADGAAAGGSSFQIRRRNASQTEAMTPFQITGAGNIVLQSGFTAGSQTLGNVGIGTSSPSSKLDVVGDAEITGLATITGSLQVADSGGLAILGTTTSAGADASAVRGFALSGAGSTIGVWGRADSAAGVGGCSITPLAGESSTGIASLARSLCGMLQRIPS